MKEFIYFALGIVVSVPIAMFAPMGGTGILARRALRNGKRAEARRRELQQNLDEVKKYHEDPQRFIIFLTQRILFVSILWIGQEVVDYFVGLLSNGTSDVVYLANKVTYDAGPLVNFINTAGSLTGILLLSFVFRVGFRAWRLARRVL